MKRLVLRFEMGQLARPGKFSTISLNSIVAHSASFSLFARKVERVHVQEVCSPEYRERSSGVSALLAGVQIGLLVVGPACFILIR